MLPDGFMYLKDDRMILSLDYISSYNFVGRPIAGYYDKVCILTEKAALALSAAQDELDKLGQGYCFKIFDAYRPLTATRDFKQWSLDFQDEKMKNDFYPNLSKSQLFDLGFISETSTHCSGSTLDLTLTQLNTDGVSTTDLDMGTIFDFFDDTAHTLSNHVSEIAQKNRLFLKTLMERHGFLNYPLEWWHFGLKDEPFPETYFDFPVRR
jgi:D-alanyl-D-alanine dipeptidase